MKKNLTELVFVLDRSGSMQGLEGDTIGGFNAMIEKQKKEPGEAFVSTVLFDDQTEVLHDRVKVGEVRPITNKEYYVPVSYTHLVVGETAEHAKGKQTPCVSNKAAGQERVW